MADTLIDCLKMRNPNLNLKFQTLRWIWPHCTTIFVKGWLKYTKIVWSCRCGGNCRGTTQKRTCIGKTRFESEKKTIKNGYDRIKTKVKEIRPNYRKAVSEERRSGSRKIVRDNWEKLKNRFGEDHLRHALRIRSVQ